MEKKGIQKKPKKQGATRPKKKEYILITGISGNIGRRIAKHLHKTENIIGIDNRPFNDRPKDIEYHQHDIIRKRTETIFRQRKIKAVIHVAVMHDPRKKTRQHHTDNITAITRLLEYCHKYNIQKIVILSSALVYGSLPDNDTYLTEESPLRGGRADLVVRDLVEMDMLAQSFFWKSPDVNVSILRPVHIVGAELKNTPSNYLRLNPVPVLSGFDPMIQFIYIDDFIQSIVCCLKTDARGVFNIVGGGAAPLRAILHSTGKELLEIPGYFLKKYVSLGWKWNFIKFMPEELRHLHYACMIDGNRAKKELGFSAKYSLKETIESLTLSQVKL